MGGPPRWLDMGSDSEQRLTESSNSRVTASLVPHQPTTKSSSPRTSSAAEPAEAGVPPLHRASSSSSTAVSPNSWWPWWSGFLGGSSEDLTTKQPKMTLPLDLSLTSSDLSSVATSDGMSSSRSHGRSDGGSGHDDLTPPAAPKAPQAVDTSTASSLKALRESCAWGNDDATRLPKPHQKRVPSLLVEHDGAMQELKEAAAHDPLFNPSHPYFDELGRLRFLISAKYDPQKAAVNLRSALALRQQFQLDAVREMVLRGVPSREWFTSEGWRTMEMHTTLSETIIQPQGDGPVLSLTKLSQIDQHEVAKDVSAEDFRHFARARNEAIYAILDAVTRRTGYITHMVRIMLVADFRVSMMSLELTKMSAVLAEQTQCLFPQVRAPMHVHPCTCTHARVPMHVSLCPFSQLLGGLVVTGLSTPLKFCYDHVIRHLLSTKLQEKVMLVDVNKVSGSPYVSLKTHLTSRCCPRHCQRCYRCAHAYPRMHRNPYTYGIRVCICVCISVCICVCICVHTHTHAPTSV